jgi:hypothetical protein
VQRGRVEVAKGEDSSVRAVAGERTLEGAVDAGGPSGSRHVADVSQTQDIAHFYRYGARVDWLEPIILNHRIYAPTPRELNDPREARPRFSNVSAEDVAEYVKAVFVAETPDVPSERYAQVAAAIDSEVTHSTVEHYLAFASERLYSLTEKRRIFSMSKRWNNLALWANYANKHQGYCLEFAKSGLFSTAREVVYDDTFRFALCKPSPENAQLYFYKTPEWRNEAEVRPVFQRSFVGPAFPIEPEWLSSIIVGKARPPNILRSVMSFRVPNAWRMRFASCSSYAIGSCC